MAFPDAQTFAAVPFHFWSVVFFIFGSMVGSFLNVCIHRMPRGLSIVNPPSNCPHCGYRIPFYLNIPLVTWLYLRGRCASCSAAISVRYLVVELMTALAFLGCWLAFGHVSAGQAVVDCVLLAGFIAATFIDFEHFIIPDEITLGGIAVGFLCSFAVPVLHGARTAAESLRESFWGIVVGGGLVYGILRLGKVLFGRQHFQLAANTRVIFLETALVLPDREVPYEEIFYRKSDAILLQARRVELIDRCYVEAPVRLTPVKLTVGDDSFDPEQVRQMEASTDLITIPREAMGFGDVKFMAAIGAFLGWQGAVFSLMASAIVGAVVGVTLIVCQKREWSSRLPYGPYIALAATVWIFGGQRLVLAWLASR